MRGGELCHNSAACQIVRSAVSLILTQHQASFNPKLRYENRFLCCYKGVYHFLARPFSPYFFFLTLNQAFPWNLVCYPHIHDPAALHQPTLESRTVSPFTAPAEPTCGSPGSSLLQSGWCSLSFSPRYSSLSLMHKYNFSKWKIVYVDYLCNKCKSHSNYITN